MAELKKQPEHGPELENEVLTETVRRLPKQGAWTCGTRRFSLDGGEETGAAVILAVSGEKGERLMTLSSADDWAYEGLLSAFAQELVLRGEGPQEIRAGDELSGEILGRFCRTVGITLKREKEAAAMFREAEWQSEHPEAGEKAIESDSFFVILMQLRDEEFARMPRDLAERLMKMSEKGLAPKKLAERIRALCIT